MLMWTTYRPRSHTYLSHPARTATPQQKIAKSLCLSATLRNTPCDPNWAAFCIVTLLYGDKDPYSAKFSMRAASSEIKFNLVYLDL